MHRPSTTTGRSPRARSSRARRCRGGRPRDGPGDRAAVRLGRPLPTVRTRCPTAARRRSRSGSAPAVRREGPPGPARRTTSRGSPVRTARTRGSPTARPRRSSRARRGGPVGRSTPPAPRRPARPRRGPGESWTTRTTTARSSPPGRPRGARARTRPSALRGHPSSADLTGAAVHRDPPAPSAVRPGAGVRSQGAALTEDGHPGRPRHGAHRTRSSSPTAGRPQRICTAPAGAAGRSRRAPWPADLSADGALTTSRPSTWPPTSTSTPPRCSWCHVAGGRRGARRRRSNGTRPELAEAPVGRPGPHRSAHLPGTRATGGSRSPPVHRGRRITLTCAPSVLPAPRRPAQARDTCRGRPEQT